MNKTINFGKKLFTYQQYKIYIYNACLDKSS